MPALTRRLMLGFAATVALAGPVLAQSYPQTLAGSYHAEGRNPDGTHYTGSVIIQEDGTELRFSWKTGATSYTGTGTRDGRVVTIDWSADAPVIYVIMETGELHGTWAGGRALELLVRE